MSLAVDPTTSTTLYAGTSSGSVLMSIDGAGSWGAISMGLSTNAVRVVVIDPTTSILYAGTAGGVFVFR